MERQNNDNTHLDKNRPVTEAEMRCAGIVRVPADVFRYREYTYTNLKDAMAQSQRDVAAKPS